MNIIILILISQHNNMRQGVIAFYLNSQLTKFFYLPLKIGYLDFVVKFFWKYCVSSKSFAHSLIYIYIFIFSRILAYFAVDNEMKLFFLALFFLINKKITSLLQPTNLYKYVSIYVIFFSFSLSRFSFLFFSLLLLFFYIQFQKSDYVYVYG